MKNVYYITNMFPGKKDNYGIFCKKVFDFFNDSDFFCVKKMSAIYGKSHKKIYNIFRYIFFLSSIMKTLIFKIDTIDLIYIQYVWKHAFFVSMFSNYIIKKEKKVVINFHGEDLTKYDILSLSEKKSFKKICELSQLIIVPSAYFKNLLLSILPIDSNRIFISPSGGVDSIKFFKNKVFTDEKVLVYCSRFDKDKGWDDFIKAIKYLTEKKINLKAIMIGYGNQTQDVYNFVDENNLNEYIEIYSNISQERISDIYARAMLFIFSTRLEESLGLVALEAMSCGLPIIASNIGAISEYVMNNENGYLYESGNVDDLIDKIELYFKLNKRITDSFSSKSIKKATEYKDKNVQNDFIKKMKELF